MLNIVKNYRRNNGYIFKYDKKKNELISEKGNLAYPIKDGIPIMLVQEARKIKKK